MSYRRTREYIVYASEAFNDLLTHQVHSLYFEQTVELVRLYNWISGRLCVAFFISVFRWNWSFIQPTLFLKESTEILSKLVAINFSLPQVINYEVL